MAAKRQPGPKKPTPKRKRRPKPVPSDGGGGGAPAAVPPASSAPGGSAAPASNNGPTVADRKDADLVRRAIKERWPIPDDVREALPGHLGKILADSEDARARVAAAKALIEADKLNLEQEKRDQGIPDRLDLTSGGKPLADLKTMTDDDLRRRIAELGGRAGGPGPAPPGG